MLENLFSREHTNATFLQELLHQDIDKEWLEAGLKEEHIDINHQDENGDTFLMIAFKASRLRSVAWLIYNNADTTIKNNKNKTIINIAIEKNNLKMITELLNSKKIDINQKDIDGRSLLQNVVVFGKNKIAKLFIDYGIDINNTDHHGRNVLYDALSFGDKHFIKYLISLDGMNIDFVDYDGNSLMQHPEVLKNDTVAKDLLVAGVSPTIQSQEKESYLFKIALRDEDEEDAEEIINLALEYGANVNDKTSNGNTIVMELIAISTKLCTEEINKKNRLLKIAKDMLKHNGDVNVLDANNENELFNAIRAKDFDLASFLLSHDINPNIQNNNKETALSLIILDGTKSIDLILLLLTYEATPNLKNKKGQTLYEVLNNVILYIDGAILLEDKELISKIDTDKEYIMIIKELLAHNEDNLNYLNSLGDPLFFKPLFYEHIILFKLYMRYGLDINTKNKANHNIFFEYVLKIFEDNNSNPRICDLFKTNLHMLIHNKVEQNYQDALGFTILHKIVSTKCNEELFDILIKTVVFDYTITDNLGRSIIHNAVWNNKNYIIKKIYEIDSSIINIVDNYSILPITYAALLGNQELVLLFLELNSNTHISKKIPNNALKKFKPMLKNLSTLEVGLENSPYLSKIKDFIRQIKLDFNDK